MVQAFHLLSETTVYFPITFELLLKWLGERELNWGKITLQFLTRRSATFTGTKVEFGNQSFFNFLIRLSSRISASVQSIGNWLLNLKTLENGNLSCDHCSLSSKFQNGNIIIQVAKEEAAAARRII